MAFEGQLLQHFRHLNTALDAVGADASVDVRSLELQVRYRGRAYLFRPQFAYLDDQRRRCRTAAFAPEVSRFVGWSPYFSKRWDLAVDKLRFKAYASAHGLPTPAYWADAPSELNDVVTKSIRPGGGVRGPYRRAVGAEPGRYYERFIRGKVLKIWFWDGAPVCCEAADGCAVRGDGVRSVRELIAERCLEHRHGSKVKVESFTEFLAYQGKSLDAVPPAGEVQPVDFRYGSLRYFGARVANIDLQRDRLPGVSGDRLGEIGARLLLGIPETIRQNTLFTVDAVLDAAQRPWIVAMDNEPFLHPYVYEPMLRTWARNPESALAPTAGADAAGIALH
jgi:hypothetical protein